MVRIKKPLLKNNYNKKLILISTILFTILIAFVIPNEFSASLLDMLKDAISGVISFFIRNIANGTNKVIESMGAGVDKLIYNCADGINSATVLDGLNLTLLSSESTISPNLYKLYILFLYMAGAVLSFIGLWISVDFVRCSNDARHRAVLKSRLMKLILSIVLITSIPTIFDILCIINQTICDVFRMFIVDNASDFSVDKGGFLVDIFKDLAEGESDNVVYALIYLVATIVNFWLIFFYMIRDLSISFLFIVAPVIAVVLPYRTDLITQWFKELCSNIFSQSIQAFMMTVVILIATGAKKGNLYSQIFALLAFAMFIPMTSQIKRLLGFEGEMGAAKSNAGLGAMIGAVGVGASVGGALVKNASNFKTAFDDYRNINGEMKDLKKSQFGDNGSVSNLSVGTGGGISKVKMGNSSGIYGNLGTGGRGQTIDPNNRSATNRNFNVDSKLDNKNTYTATSRARQLEGLRNNARRNMVKAVGGGVFGSVGSLAMGVGTAGLGSPMVSVMAAKGGESFGSSVGEVAGSGVHRASTKVGEFGKDRVYGKGVRYDGEQNEALNSLFEGVESFSPSNIKRNLDTIRGNYNSNREIIKRNKANLEDVQANITGLDKNSMTPYQYKRETDAILKRNNYERRGMFDKAHRVYANNTYNRREGLGVNSTPYFTQLGGGLAPSMLGGNNNPKINPPTPNGNYEMSGNDLSYINTLNSSLKEHTNDFINSQGFNMNDFNYTSELSLNFTTPSDYSANDYTHPQISYNFENGETIVSSKNEMQVMNNADIRKYTENARQQHIDKFMNNQNYMIALNMAKDSIAEPFISGVNSQLV